MSYYKGKRDGITLYAWWKDGIQYVGGGNWTLKKALEDIDKEERKYNLEQMKELNKGLDKASKEPF